MFKCMLSILLISATIALSGCGGGGGGGSSSNTLVQLVSITVTPASSNIVIGATRQFTATGTYTDNHTEDLTNIVFWSSSNLSAATISGFGLVTAVDLGQTTITATSGTISGTTTLTVKPNLTVTTIAGQAGTPGTADGTGANARFGTNLGSPDDVTSDGTNLYVTDTFNHTIRKIVIATGEVTTVAGLPGSTADVDATIPNARFTALYGITTDGTNIYVTEGLNHTIRKIVIATGVVTTLAGSPGLSGTDDGTGSAARFDQPRGITRVGANLYVADDIGPDSTRTSGSIRKIDANGVVTTIATIQHPIGITSDGNNLYVTDEVNQIVYQMVIPAAGSAATPVILAGSPGVAGDSTTSRFNKPHGIVTDGTSIFVADFLNNSIRKIEIASKTVSTVIDSNMPGPLGITLIGDTMYTTNGDFTIKQIQ